MASPQIELNRIIRDNRVDEFPTPNRRLGMRPVEFTPGKSRWVWESQPEGTINPFGTIQGGYLALFVDEILSTAIGSVLEEDEWAVTAELKMSYLRALTPQRLEGRGRVIRRTRGAAFLDAQVTNAAAQTAVIASSTWLISRSGGRKGSAS
ncbi:MAG TPA: PaaI family thioesterase [Candidatus Binataceae bacterium]|nr:PaaI family thioesterase [Candidatus Binataceae bacterium]